MASIGRCGTDIPIPRIAFAAWPRLQAVVPAALLLPSLLFRRCSCVPALG